MLYKPKEMARAVNVSVSTLRYYESCGIVPAPVRGINGYRKYTHIHLSYFRVIRTLLPAFGMKFVSNVLMYIQKSDVSQAFWLVTEAQSILLEEKKAAQQTLELLSSTNPIINNSTSSKDLLYIGQISKLLNLAPSAIRYWEKRGLIISLRSKENRYRLYTQSHIRQISLLRTMRNSVYSLDDIKGILKALELDNVYQAIKVATEAMETINQRNRILIKGTFELYHLCEVSQILHKY